MNTLIFNDPPPKGAQVSVSYHDPSNGNSFTLFMFIGDGKTTVYNFATFIIDQRRITITVNGVMLSSIDWVITSTYGIKSAVWLQSEKEYDFDRGLNEQIYCAPYTITEHDERKDYTTIQKRLTEALAKRGRILCFVRWGVKEVVYRKATK